jgi:hypothetical protein
VDHALDALLADVGDSHLRAFVREQMRRSATHSAGGAGDERAATRDRS